MGRRLAPVGGGTCPVGVAACPESRRAHQGPPPLFPKKRHRVRAGHAVRIVPRRQIWAANRLHERNRGRDAEGVGADHVQLGRRPSGRACDESRRDPGRHLGQPVRRRRASGGGGSSHAASAAQSPEPVPGQGAWSGGCSRDAVLGPVPTPHGQLQLTLVAPSCPQEGILKVRSAGLAGLAKLLGRRSPGSPTATQVSQLTRHHTIRIMPTNWAAGAQTADHMLAQAYGEEAAHSTGSGLDPVYGGAGKLESEHRIRHKGGLLQRIKKKVASL